MPLSVDDVVHAAHRRRALHELRLDAVRETERVDGLERQRGFARRIREEDLRGKRVAGDAAVVPLRLGVAHGHLRAREPRRLGRLGARRDRADVRGRGQPRDDEVFERGVDRRPSARELRKRRRGGVERRQKQS
eukprot:29232-Pelagococcus_subviridis.AAC.2